VVSSFFICPVPPLYKRERMSFGKVTFSLSYTIIAEIIFSFHRLFHLSLNLDRMCSWS